ncbi:ATP-dependent acyl-CoA ligase [Rhodococcus sp. ACPA4]|uniref:AMP-binding protein n=1 Tax=Rhodococcus sp. ACPA4 TaxID=2028571 RepID=UPI000BB15192|nr:AMP-binding protein [Rhodococcus sp. ACPA4]PBC36122.1 ATP-dependent acyl-CoA ligase [Rhodococcus sp. ACPA4]
MSNLPPVDRRTIRDAFDRALAAHPDKLAHVSIDGSWTFTQAYERALHLSSGLMHHGLVREKTVALMLDNSIDFVHTWMGAALIGAVEVPVNTGYRGNFLAHILNDAGSEVLVIEERYLDRLELIAADLLFLQTVVVRGETKAKAPAPFTTVRFEDLLGYGMGDPVDLDASDLMAYMYTSGTTGASKGVEITHAHAYTYASREDQPRPTADDRILVTLPLFHLAGQWYGAYQALIVGATCFLEPGFSVSGFWPMVRRHEITMTVMLGAMAELLQQRDRCEDDADNSLDLAVMAPLASDPKAFAQRFGLTLEPVYGMSEIGSLLGSYGTELVPGEAGVARETEYELRLVRPDGSEVDDDEVGELWVRPRDPRIVMACYHGLPDKTAETLQDGWVHTGDAFRRIEGHYFFADRMKDALRRRGENISSFEVERVINTHHDVYESAVVGVPSKLTEDEIKAIVVPRDGVTIDPVALTEFLIERLPYFMVPRFVCFVDELPKTPTQKIQKHMLRADAAHVIWDREEAGIIVRKGN